MTITFNKPPIIEFSLGVQLAPLVKLTNGHFGLFWQDLDESWTVPCDQPPIQDQFEVFDTPRRQFLPASDSLSAQPHMWSVHADE